MSTLPPEMPLVPDSRWPDDEISLRFTYHPPLPGQPELYEEVRAKAHELARLIVRAAPRSREHDIALTRLDEAVFWTNAAIARRSLPPVPEEPA